MLMEAAVIPASEARTCTLGLETCLATAMFQSTSLGETRPARLIEELFT